MGCSRSGGTEHTVLLPDGEPTGIFSGHAYGIVKIFELVDEGMLNERKTHRLLIVRNPWGKSEWIGKWSTDSDEMETHRDEIKKFIDELEEEERFDYSDDNDGLFIINYKSFREIFNKIFIA